MKRRAKYYKIRGGKVYARLKYTDSTGRIHDLMRRADSITHAKELVEQMRREVADYGEHSLQASHVNFADLVSYYEKNYLIEAEYHDGRKVRGRRSLKGRGVGAQVKALGHFFGRKRLRSVTYADLAGYKSQRLKTPIISPKTKARRQRSIASVNRELALLRNMLNVALQNGWILKNPFHGGPPLINLADEKKRQRILTRDEERLLLDACAGPRAHLRPLLVCALDTGMRQGEMLKLLWRDVDLENRIITIQSFNTKTMKERHVSMTARLADELLRLWEASPKDGGVLVFGILSNVKRSFMSVRKIAGLTDVRFHDLRHSHASRLTASHIPLAEVGRVLGHSQVNTTFRYVNANVETARRASAALDAFHAEGEERSAAEFVN
jgi:integrase